MPDPSSPQHAYQFGDFILEPSQQRLTRDDQQVVPLTPKAFDTLLCLIERSGELVSKNDLLQRIWPNVVVEEAILARNVADLRKALGDDSNAPKYIETLPKRGYRFVAKVEIFTPGGKRTKKTIDTTLELVAESPVQRSSEPLSGVPEQSPRTFRMGGAWPWIAVGLLLAAAMVWWAFAR